jgi:hypothetical protein
MIRGTPFYSEELIVKHLPALYLLSIFINFFYVHVKIIANLKEIYLLNIFTQEKLRDMLCLQEERVPIKR